MESRRIVVTVKAARNLSARDRTNTADTYAVLSVPQGSAAVRYHTKPAHKSLDPVWTSGVFDVFVSQNVSRCTRTPRAPCAPAPAASLTDALALCATAPWRATQKRSLSRS